MTAKKPEGERIFEGLGVSPGIGIGVAQLRESGAIVVPEYRIPAGRVAAERARFKEAVIRSRQQIGQLRAEARAMPGVIEEELTFLLDAYLLMLRDSRLVRGVERRIGESRVNAEAAVQAELSEIAEGFAALDDKYIAARMVDIREVGDRLVRNLTLAPMKSVSLVPKGSIIVSEELTPADTAKLKPERVAGIATALGGTEGHTAIMARALGLPAVLGATGVVEGVHSGDALIVDGDSGQIVANPAPDTLEHYQRRREEQLRERRRLGRLRDRPAVTRDGTEAVLMANVELPVELNMVSQHGAAGIGLLRTEYLFMSRDDIPDEEEQYNDLREMIEGVDGRPVTIRTLDVGGEKTVAALMGTVGDSARSALGMRGIRLSLVREDVLEEQFRAILRAGAHGKVRILLPMVTAVSEVVRARQVLARAVRQLEERGIPISDPLPPVGVMIEVPGAALSADSLARVSDFFAIGSNDLTMYTLAADRGDEQVAHLYDPLHPAVLRLIHFSVESALRSGIPVSICGEMAGDPRYTALLMGLGLRLLSMAAANIPRVKERIRRLDLMSADSRARVIMDQVDPVRIATLLDDFNAQG
jgi:phosphoenolpyruvate-protein phosphotransferase (PTS system enzyme I)